MTEFRIVWCECPHNQHSSRVLFVEADSVEDAKAIAKDYIERTYGVHWFSFFSAEPSTPVPAGRVK